MTDPSEPDASPPRRLSDRLTDVPGIAVGNWTDIDARTGCTVVVLPEGTTGSVDVRGGAPASRELALLEPTRSVQTVDAVVLTGGSAFGLASADGVVAHLEGLGRGHVTPFARVPIVPALGVFDLGVGDATVRPDKHAGWQAAQAATTGDHAIGAVGVGAGCTVDKWLGPDGVRAGGLVAASETVAGDVVAVLVAVNALGSIGHATDGAQGRVGGSRASRTNGGMNTTIGVVATSACLDKVSCNLLAQSAHDGLARAVFPTHTRYDGDAFIAVATNGAGQSPDLGADAASDPLHLDALRVAVTRLVERAILTLGPSAQEASR